MLSSQYHDASLWCVNVGTARTVVLSLTTVNNVDWQLTFHGVEYFKCDNLQQGNVVLDIELVPPQSISERTLSFLGASVQKEALNTILDDLRAGRKTLVRVNPSFGCTIICLCAGVTEQALHGS